MFEGYKAQRKGMPAELAQQLPVLKDLLHLLGYRTVECDGFEADARNGRAVGFSGKLAVSGGQVPPINEIFA